MRETTNAEKVQQFMLQLGRKTKGIGRVYFTGGTSAVLEGWREMTLDIDLCFSTEPKGAFEAIAQLKQTLNINIELASPSDFIPPLPDWESRSHFIDQVGSLQFFHYDFYSQALAKIERGHQKDLLDVQEMHKKALIDIKNLQHYFSQIEPQLLRYPAIDPNAFREKVEEFVAKYENL